MPRPEDVLKRHTQETGVPMVWLNRLANVMKRRDLNKEIDEELQFHLDAKINDNLAAGMSDDEARRDAFRRAGRRV